ncbi:hypothetical protein GCM10028803_31410 [Larkinella knui]|uniref:Uncharacterized protein n=1 Tax=Larkinella knui TaxID=2025310 RepID=A0A3P1CYV5_9BACT|nr:hypothetical protein [Larkinella knui]RRB18166.1 hypothetical protein EHT87_07785 [Larkinella knui]
MKIQELYNIVIEPITDRISRSNGLNQFAQRRAKFEGWLKVELIDIFVKFNINALPEIDRIDISFDDVAIELKTANTNIGYENVISTTRPITKNTADIIEDIACLQTKNHLYKFVIFVVFPIHHENSFWQKQFQRIQVCLESIMHKEFTFDNNVPAVIYIGKVPNLIIAEKTIGSQFPGCSRQGR